ncbi:MAG: glycoside hydrolase domain-containing protein [Thermoguttaceae bacterium]
MKRLVFAGVVLLMGCCSFMCPALYGAEVELIDAQTPWRAHLTLGAQLRRDQEGLVLSQRQLGRFRHESAPDGRSICVTRLGKNSRKETIELDECNGLFSPLPAADWVKTDFDDSAWARCNVDDLGDYLGGYGVPKASEYGQEPAVLCLRTCFGITDPVKATDLKVTVAYIGGAVVYVNGQEVGRGHLPAKDTHPVTPAEDYPIAAYTAEDGTTPLPCLNPWVAPEAKWLERYQKRARTFTVAVPSRILVKGRNVLAVELHRSAIAGPIGPGWKAWCHVGFRQVKLSSASGAGTVPYAEAIQGTHLWSANTVDQVAEGLSTKPLIARGWHWTLIWTRGMPVRGIPMANPFDPVLPVKILAPRNGVGNGQAVLSDLAGLQGVTAKVEAFQGPAGAKIPAGAVEVRFAAQHPGVHYCDALLEKAPEGAKTVPVWLIVHAPKDAAPGWYVSTLNLTANGKSFAVPVQVLVAGFKLPDPKDFSSTIGVTQSPETLAMHYQVEPWSDAHFKLLEKSFALMGQVGNDHVRVTAVNPAPANWKLQMIRWVKTGGGLKPDFSILEKYLDTYVKYCAPPRALTVYVWDRSTSPEVAFSYDGGAVPTRAYARGNRIPTVTVWDPVTKTSSEVKVPRLLDEGAEAIYKPLLEGVRALVVKRGWSERIIMLGLGYDERANLRTGELMRTLAPYARWDLLAHFSGDRGPKDGKWIVTGGLEVGVAESPWSFLNAVGGESAQWKAIIAKDNVWKVLSPKDKGTEFLQLPTDRWKWQEYSAPLVQADGGNPTISRVADGLRGFLSERGWDAASAETGGAEIVLETATRCPRARTAGFDPNALRDAGAEGYALIAREQGGRPLVVVVGKEEAGVDAGAAWLLSKLGWRDGRLTIAPISAVRNPFIRGRSVHLGDAALLKSLRFAQEDRERLCTTFWPEPRLAEYAAQIRACGFNAVEKAMCDYEVKRTEENTRCYLDLSRGVHPQGMRMVAFLWGVDLLKDRAQIAELAKSIGRETDHVVTHWRDPGPGGYEKPMRMTADVLSEFRKANPKVQVTLSTWANNGFWKSRDDASFLDESLAPR